MNTETTGGPLLTCDHQDAGTFSEESTRQNMKEKKKTLKH